MILLAILFCFITKEKYFKQQPFLNIEEITNKIFNNICECDKTNIINPLSDIYNNDKIQSCCNWWWRIMITKARALLFINSKWSLIYINKVFLINLILFNIFNYFLIKLILYITIGTYFVFNSIK